MTFCSETRSTMPTSKKPKLKIVEGSERAPKYFDVGIYKMTEDGLKAEPTVGNGRQARQVEKIISAPFEILGRVRNSNGEGWARLLQWNDKDGKPHKHAVSDADLHSDHKVLFGELAGRGLYITTDKERTHLIRYLNAVEVSDRVTEVADINRKSRF